MRDIVEDLIGGAMDHLGRHLPGRKPGMRAALL